MNLEKLFNAQKQLDEFIIESKGLERQDLLDKKILALLVELGELANEWRGFKFWSNKQSPNKPILTTSGATTENAVQYSCSNCEERFIVNDKRLDDLFGSNIDDCPECEKGFLMAFRFKNPLLEEYVDCLHFILSIGNDLGYTWEQKGLWKRQDTTKHFNSLFLSVSTFFDSIESDFLEEEKQEHFEDLYSGFLGLGEMLGFTWDEIENAYFEKHAINIQRQETGY